MAKENTKSPLKQDTDKRYRRQVYTGMGDTMQDRLIKGAYLAARSEAPDYGWMNVVGAGVKAFKTDYDARKAIESAERETTIGSIDKIVEGIYETGGSLPEAYFDKAYDFTQELREKYIAAVEAGDTKEEHKIKGQLNAFATQVSNTKTDLTDGAGLWNDKMLIDQKGFTKEQLNIQASVKEENVILDEGVYKWKNINWDPSDPESKEFYTMEDYQNSQPLRDDIATQSYLDENKNVIEAKDKWLNGEGGDFDYKTQYEKNGKLVTKENIQSMLWDDVSKQGSFAGKYLDEHPDFDKIFDVMNNDESGQIDALSIGVYDSNKDGVVDYRDFIDPNTPEGVAFFNKYDDPNNNTPGVIDDDELQTIMWDDDSLKAIQDIAKIKIKSALTDVSNKNFDFNTSKRIVTDFFTLRQEKMFYGNKSIKQYKRMVPDQPNSKVKIGTDKDNKGKLMMSDGTVITDLKDYVEKGGSVSLLDEMGWSWNPTSKKFEHNANWGTLTKTPPTTKSR